MDESRMSRILPRQASELLMPTKPDYKLDVPDCGYKIVQYEDLREGHLWARGPGLGEPSIGPSISQPSPARKLFEKTKDLFSSPVKSIAKKVRADGDHQSLMSVSDWGDGVAQGHQDGGKAEDHNSENGAHQNGSQQSQENGSQENSSQENGSQQNGSQQNGSQQNGLAGFEAPLPPYRLDDELMEKLKGMELNSGKKTEDDGQGDKADAEEDEQPLLPSAPASPVKTAPLPERRASPQTARNFEGGIRVLGPAPIDMDDSHVPEHDLGRGIFLDSDAEAISFRGFPSRVKVQPSNKWPRLNPNGPVLSTRGKEVYLAELAKMQAGRLLTFAEKPAAAKASLKPATASKKPPALQVLHSGEWAYAGSALSLISLARTVGISNHDSKSPTLLGVWAEQSVAGDLVAPLRSFLEFTHKNVLGAATGWNHYKLSIKCIRAGKKQDTGSDKYLLWHQDEEGEGCALRIGTTLLGPGDIFQKNRAFAVEELGEGIDSEEEKQWVASVLKSKGEEEQLRKGELAFWYALPHERAAVRAEPFAVGDRVVVELIVGTEEQIKPMEGVEAEMAMWNGTVGVAL